MDVYADGDFIYEAPDDKIMVIHTLTVDPKAAGKGIGSAFVDFYEKLAKQENCIALRLDTNARNTGARAPCITNWDTARLELSLAYSTAYLM